MPARIKILQQGDLAALSRVAPDVLDGDVRDDLAREFLADPRHHLAVAVDNETIVGIASAVHYIHPDKPPELWINEVCVAATHREQGLGKMLLNALFEVAKALGCTEAWVLIDRSNTPAMRLYSSVGGHPSDQVMFTFKFPIVMNSNDAAAD